jgi:pentose-5-phosphate-3-epimerase
MDRFAPWFGLSMEILTQVKTISSLPMDVHLMVEDVERTTEMVLGAGADLVTVPSEADWQ